MLDVHYYYRLIKKSFAFFFVSAAFCLAALIRIVPPYDRIFTEQGIRFAGTDAYYHIRLIENLLRHYPHRITFDPYICFPTGAVEMTHFWPPFFDWLLGSFCLLFGFGHPSQQVIDMVAAFSPAILGALTVFPVYFIGKYLLNPWCGVLAAILLAVMPGEFLGRSILGFTDHHVAEVLFSTTAMAILLKTIRAVSSPLPASDQSGRSLLIIMGTCLLSGLFFGMYLTTWTGALLFIIILVLFFIVQSILDYFKGQSSTALMTIGTVILLSASGFSLLLLPTGYLGSANRYFFPLTLLACAAVPVGLVLITQIMRHVRCRAIVYPIVLLGPIVILALIGVALAPTYIQSLYAELQSVRSLNNKNILETWPLLYPAGQFSLVLVWNYFGASFIMAVLALFWLIRDGARHAKPENMLLIIWSLVMFALILYSRRFAYYLAINISLLTGWIVCRLISSCCFKHTSLMKASKPNPMRPDKDSPDKHNGMRHHRARLIVCLIVVFTVVYAPCLSLAIHASRRSFFGPSNAWMVALNWLKNNTPEPFNDPDYYYRLYKPPTTNMRFIYPGSAYGIMAWWDYGHWIVRVAHRIPISTPFQWGAAVAGNFFTSLDEPSADKIMTVSKARYVIVDHETALAKFHATLSFAGKREEDFREIYYVFSQGEYRPLPLFYPAYYRSMSVRLFCFNGEAVKANECQVYSFKQDKSPNGSPRKVILDSMVFTSEEAATAYIRSQKNGRYVIAGGNPFVSPVNLDALNHYRLVFCFPQSPTSKGSFTKPPEIKIFEYYSP
ncbi:MAG: oligosaccharyl transferase, archaeosortase A system-associated [Kiritimatiellia bacterium]|nr:oligosaccharyl transferase, archaeosortase A system-associated [Kiritimatiellia bacterium]